MPIKIIIAQPHGFCGNDNFGVKRALKIAQETGGTENVYLLGEIVHNPHVVKFLEEKYKVKTVQHLDEIPVGSTVIIRAHGASPTIYHKAKTKGLKIVDATCPLVAQVHQEVKKLAAEGKKILYVASDKTHDEAVGVAGEAPEAVFLSTLKELPNLKIADPKNTIVLTQTTLSILETKVALENLKKKYPQVSIKPHICFATTERQQAIMTLAKKVGCIVIVGSPTSSNSKRLQEVAQAVGVKAYLVDNPKELRPSWFKGVETVGVSSGASTPEWLLEEVIDKIKTF